MITIDGNSLSIDEVVRVSREYESVTLDDKSIPAINRSRRYVEKVLAEERVVYGITTGVGELANKFISAGDAEKMQENLIRSHATSVGEPFSEDVVRGIILLRANAVTKGFSGIRVSVINLLLDLLNNRAYPYIPRQGSVGASGDLSPLAHLALVLMGEGECLKEGKRVPSLSVLDAAGLKPVRLQPKEGLALINGTQIMSSLGCLAVDDAEKLLQHAQIAGAMSLEALRGTSKAYDARIHEVRPHPGQIRCASNMRQLIKGSEIVASHKNCEKVQDAYTLRCIPQVYGAVLDTIEYVKGVFSIEINSATDNPLIFEDPEEAISGGNFHGEPLAFALDFLGIAMAEIGNISERTADRLVNPHVSGLPPFLAENSGLNSGYMIAQYTAAALVSENKILAHPASVDSIPTSAGQEDHVSMGPIAGRHAVDIIRNVEQIIAIEMLAAAQGIDFQKGLKPGKGTNAAWKEIRRHIPHLDEDRVMYPDMEKMLALIKEGAILRAVEQAVGRIM
jgi:histidine ammonia-lyase